MRTMIVMIMLMKSIHEHKTSWEIEDCDEQESQVIRMVSELPINANAPEKRIPSQLQGSKILDNFIKRFSLAPGYQTTYPNKW